MPQDPAETPVRVQIVSSLSKTLHPTLESFTQLTDSFVGTALGRDPSCPAVAAFHVPGGHPNLADDLSVAEDGAHGERQDFRDSEARKPLGRDEAAVPRRQLPDDREEHPFFKGVSARRPAMPQDGGSSSPPPQCGVLQLLAYWSGPRLSLITHLPSQSIRGPKALHFASVGPRERTVEGKPIARVQGSVHFAGDDDDSVRLDHDAVMELHGVPHHLGRAIPR